MDYTIKLKSGKTFVFGLKTGTIADVEKQLNKVKFIQIGQALINADEIEYIEPKS